MRIEHIDISKITALLLEKKYITNEDLKKAQGTAEKNHYLLLGYFVNQRLITRDVLGKVIAEVVGVPFIDLAMISPSRATVLLVPEDIAKKHHVILYKDDEHSIHVATDNPTEKQIPEVLKNLFPKKKLNLVFAFKEDIESAFIHYRKTLETRFFKIIKEKKNIAPEILDEILEDALTLRASDIHFEPQEKELIIRFRVDGVLQEVGRLAKVQYENMLNRIKVQTHLRTDEHFSAQDGAFRFQKDDQYADVRVSIIPTLDGEKVVMRLLAQYISGLNLADLGFSTEDEETLTRASQKPFGMILVTGPTGSGKTTTLYALLKLLNGPDVNITTIEDPVEYKMVGVNHIQVNQETNLTFSEGLRSIVRQDPDIILVGEIRDRETAQIAVNAALTGHLLLSTFHANDAATAVPRLLDMGVEPFLLASTLEVIVAQRLARRICQQCRETITLTQNDINTLNVPNLKDYLKEKKMTFYKGGGCEVCGHSGYKGRVGIYEFIQNSPEMQELILKNPSSREIWNLAQNQGARSLFEDGLTKVHNGLTSLEELLRIATPSEYKTQ